MWPTVPHFTDPPPVSQPAYVLFFSPDFFPAFLMCFSISHFMVLQLVGKRVEMGSRRILQRCTCFDFNFPPCEKCIANIAIFFRQQFDDFPLHLSLASPSPYPTALPPPTRSLYPPHSPPCTFASNTFWKPDALCHRRWSLMVRPYPCVCVMNMLRCTGKDIGYERNPISPV